MNRRTMLAGVGSTLACYSLNAKEQKTGGNDLGHDDVGQAYYVPADVVVDYLPSPAEVINQGSLLFQLTSPELDRRKTRLSTLAKATDILEHPLIDGHAQELINLLDGDVAIANATSAFGRNIADTYPSSNSFHYVGTAMQATAKSATSTAKKKKKHAETALGDAKAMVAILRYYTQLEEELLKTLQNALAPTAPYRGIFRPCVEERSFQKKGRLLGHFARS